jgi:ferrous iron transport protein B
VIVALLASFVRKENTIPTLAVLYGAGQEGMGLGAALSGVLTPAAALSFLVVQVLFIPCVATVAAIHQETRSWRWTGLSVGLMLVVSFGLGLAVYQGARFLGLGL